MNATLLTILLLVGLVVVIVVVQTVVGRGVEHVVERTEVSIASRVIGNDEVRASARSLIKFYVRRPLGDVTEALQSECRRLGGVPEEASSAVAGIAWAFHASRGPFTLRVRLSAKGETVSGVIDCPESSFLQTRQAKVMVSTRREILALIESLGGRWEARDGG